MKKKLVTGLAIATTGFFAYRFLTENSDNEGTSKGGSKKVFDEIDINNLWNSIERKFSDFLIDNSTRHQDQKTSFKKIIYYWERLDKYKNKNRLAYILATVIHESKLGHPSWVREFSSGSQYEGRADLGNTQTGDGVRFKGRGLVQITGRGQYKRLSDDYNRYHNNNIDLVSNPDLAATNKNVSAFIAVYGMLYGKFTTKKLNQYIINDKKDYYNARRTVNSTDRATHIKNIAISIRKSIDFLNAYA